ncbi:hypothetical protein [Nitrincola sp. MINF-07-Sa-05]|uniref:hypothetical protein n=1 Tax=Nitrincola salilacus TaxID=3400273 RepID=UPI0039180313
MSIGIVSCSQARQQQRLIQQRLENQLSAEFRLNKSTLIALNLPHTLAVWIEYKRQSGLQNTQISEAFS